MLSSRFVQALLACHGSGGVLLISRRVRRSSGSVIDQLAQRHPEALGELDQADVGRVDG